MFKKLSVLAATLALPSLVACSTLPASLQASSPAALGAASFGSNAVVKSTLLGGSRYASFHVTTASPGYGTQAVVHRYTSSDISYYVLTLYDMTQGSSGVAVGQVQVSPSQSAVFTNLTVNTLYKVSVAAYSDVQSDGSTGSAAVQINKNDNTAYTEFNFTSGSSANNNVNDQITYCSTDLYSSLVVHLDNAAFNGTATLDTTPGASFSVYDGQYTAPSASISASAASSGACDCSTTGGSGSSSGSGDSGSGDSQGGSGHGQGSDS